MICGSLPIIRLYTWYIILSHNKNVTALQYARYRGAGKPVMHVDRCMCYGLFRRIILYYTEDIRYKINITRYKIRLHDIRYKLMSSYELQKEQMFNFICSFVIGLTP